MKFSDLQRAFYKQTKSGINGLILFGVPGAGKGTYGSLLAKSYNFNKITPGDSIRRLLTSPDSVHDPKYLQLKTCVDKGLLVDDEIVLDLIVDEYQKTRGQYNGVIFDGIPRTLNQFEKLKERFDLNTYLVLNVELQEDILIEKLLGRRVCVACSTNYNICSIDRDGYFMKPLLPKEEGKCDNCQGTLVKRKDDKVHVIKERIGLYYRETLPILKQFEDNGIKRIDFIPKRGVDDYDKLLDLVKPFIPLP